MSGINYRPTPAAELYREKLLLRQRADLPAGLVRLPGFEFTTTVAALTDEVGKVFAKGMIQAWAAAIVHCAPSTATEWWFASLARFSIEKGPTNKLAFQLMCPHANVVQEAKKRIDRVKRKDMSALDAIADVTIEYQFALPPNLLMPLVFGYKPAEKRLLATNRNHIEKPGQFLKPSVGETTSGFLAFLGTIMMMTEADTSSKPYEDLIAASDSAMTGKLDEWLRWFHCMVDTQAAFEQDRLLIDPHRPETYYYDYSH